MKNQEIIAVVLAAEAGRRIQYRRVSFGDVWKDCDPQWNFVECDYRVKPEPLELWVNVYTNFSAAWKTKEKALENACPDAVRVAVHTREVIE